MNNKKNLFLLFVIVIAIVFSSFGQTPKNIRTINSGDLLKKGIDLFENEKYEQAAEIFRLIPKNDTNYAVALYELGLALQASEKYTEVIDLVKGILKYDHLIDNKSMLYLLLGNSLDYAKRKDEAIEVYKKALNEFPYNHQIYYELGIAYYGDDKLDKAEEAFIQAIKLNSFHQNSHYMLALTNLRRGKLVPCILAFDACCVINPESSLGYNSLETLEKLFNGELDGEMQKEKFSFPEEYDNHCFDEIEVLVKANFAVNKKYKVNSKISNIVIKQNHLIFEKLKTVESPKGLYNEYYIPFFKSLFKEDYFEGFSYYLFMGVDNENIKSLLAENKSKISKFQDWAANYLYEKRSYQLSLENEKNDKIRYFYYKNDRLSSFGRYADSKLTLNEGEWTFVNIMGGVKSKGVFNKAKKEGNWKEYYINANLDQDLLYKNDNLDGLSTKYHPNGELNIKANFKDGKLIGDYYKYNTSGVISEKNIYKDGKLDGISRRYYSQGQLFSETEYKNGKKDGVFKRYFVDGSIDLEVSYKNDQLNGKYIEFYENGNMYSEGEYKNDYRVGTWKVYYYNKQLKQEGVYDEKGNKVGLWKSYYLNGVIKQEENYSINGKQSGNANYYTKNGKLWYSYSFKNELLTEVTYYNKEKSVIVKFTEDKGIINLKAYTINGVVEAEGKLKDGKKDELWKYYDANGLLDSEENYKEGLLQGVYKSYYRNGNLSTYAEYESGEKSGLFQTFYKDGILKQEGYYANGNAEGYWYDYYNNGNISDISNYHEDNREGYQEEFDYFGKKISESYYDDNILFYKTLFDTNGVVYNIDSLRNGNGWVYRKNYDGSLSLKALYQSGQWKDTVVGYNVKGIKTYQGFYINGNRDGIHRWYYDTGVLNLETMYNYDKEEGISKTYDVDGTLYAVNKYQNGRIESKTFYYPNGKAEIQFTYENGERNGYTKYFAPDGQFTFQILYEDALPISYSYKDKNGKITSEIPIEKGNGKLMAYFQNGGKAAEINFVNGERNGKTIFYYSNGNKRKEIEYKDDLQQGWDREWNQVGKLTTEVEYLKGNLSGVKRTYYGNSKIKSEENYLNDNLHGSCKYYDKNGKLIKIMNYYFGKLLNESKM